MAVKSVTDADMDEDVVTHESSSEDDSVEDEMEASDEAEDDDDVVEVKGTKFSLKDVARDMDVEEDTSEEEDEEDQEEEEQDANDESEDENEAGKSGWADAMAKVLNMGKDAVDKTKPVLLSKAKLDHDIKELRQEPREERDSVRRAKKKEIEEKGRVKPDIVKDRTKEKTLSKLATRGVVQLFNAVKEQQKDLKTQLNEAGRSARKRERVYEKIDKEGFLEVLSGNKRKDPSQRTDQTKKVKVEEEDDNSSGWSVIRDDFMLGAKMKDWDKESENEEA